MKTITERIAKMIIRPIEKNDESEVYHMWSRYHIDELPYVWARPGIHVPKTVGPRMQWVVNPDALHQVIKLPIASYRIPIF